MIRALLFIIVFLAVGNANSQDPLQLFRQLDQLIRQEPQIKQDTQPRNATSPDSRQSAAQTPHFSEADVERMWQCEPRTSMEFPSGVSFLNRSCGKEEQNRLRQIVISKYQLDSRDPNVKMRGVREFTRDREARDERIRQEQARVQEQQRAASISERDQKRMAEENAVKERERLLKAKSIPIQNFVDAWLYFSPLKSIGQLMYSPLLSPDSGIYAGPVVLDFQEADKLLRVIGLETYGTDITYAFLRINNNVVNYAPNAMRIKAEMCVIGRYVGNQRYRTILGVEKIAPVIEAIYLGAAHHRQCYYQPNTVTEFGLSS